MEVLEGVFGLDLGFESCFGAILELFRAKGISGNARGYWAESVLEGGPSQTEAGALEVLWADTDWVWILCFGILVSASVSGGFRLSGWKIGGSTPRDRCQQRSIPGCFSPEGRKSPIAG